MDIFSLNRISKAVLFCIMILLQCDSVVSQVKEHARWTLNGNSIADKNVRIQFLTPTLVRMEFSGSGKFVDQPTAIVLKRDWQKIKVDINEQNGWLVAKTNRLTVRHLIGSGRLAGENLHISWSDIRGDHTWSPGDSDVHNLGGIASSLDGASKQNLPRFGPGILSRSGYFVLDDSRTPLWDRESDWVAPRSEHENQDMYFFVYGQDYRHVLREYSELCGKIPMIPRYVLGAWITDLNYEYLPGTEEVDKYHYADGDLRNIVGQFRDDHIPLDVFVLDFAWHKYGWKGGYDWSPIFRDPKTFLDWAHLQGLKISVNDHPGYAKEGTLSDEDSHAGTVRKVLDMPLPPPSKFFVDIEKDWKFHIDPNDSGMQYKWFDRNLDDNGWKLLQGGALWEDQGFPDYDGFAWYRKVVSVPRDVPHPAFLIFGGVDDEYDLFINGQKVAHHGSPNNSVYSTATFTDVTSFIKPGEENLVAIRVNDWGGGGGLVRTPIALSDRPPGEGIRFNLANKMQADVFMNVLHNPVIDQGVDFWWVDGGRGSCEMDGLNSQMWTNRVFYDFTEHHTRKRAFVFSRYGGWGNHRYPSLFTGDTYSDWEVLAAEVPYAAMGGNVLMPYITHDIGGFLGKKISFDLYARWVEFGALSPFLRLHSAFENPRDGNLRMPWTYGEKGVELARKYFKLRYSLLPYIYTYCRVAHDSSLPLVRPLYIEYPTADKAYATPGEYLFGSDLLVAPVTDSATQKDIYLPPGEWVDYFTDKVYEGERTIQRQCPVEEIPLFVKSGSIIPRQPECDYSDQKPLDTLIIEIYGTGPHTFSLYEDDGLSLDYRTGKYAWTTIVLSKLPSGETQVVVNPASGTFKGQVERRSYQVRLHAMPKPESVSMNNHELTSEIKNGGKWTWDREKSICVISVGAVGVKNSVKLVLK